MLALRRSGGNQAHSRLGILVRRWLHRDNFRPSCKKPFTYSYRLRIGVDNDWGVQELTLFYNSTMAQPQRSVLCRRLLHQSFSISRTNTWNLRRAEQHGPQTRRLHMPRSDHARREIVSQWLPRGPKQCIPSKNLIPTSIQPRSPHLSMRTFTSSSARPHGDLIPPKAGEERHITFIDKE